MVIPINSLLSFKTELFVVK